jgi:hypothetical protein
MSNLKSNLIDAVTSIIQKPRSGCAKKGIKGLAKGTYQVLIFMNIFFKNIRL